MRTRPSRRLGRPAIAFLALLAALATPARAHDWNGIARDQGGRLFVIDAEDGQIWRIEKDGAVHVYVPGEKAEVCRHPHHVECDAAGNLWLASG